MARFYERISKARPKGREADDRRWWWVAFDQLRLDHPALSDPEGAFIFIETSWKPSLRDYHKKKLILLLSAQRHFALRLQREGRKVIYHFSEHDYAGALAEVRQQFGIQKITTVEAAEPEVRKLVENDPSISVETNPFFITSRLFYNRVFRSAKRRLLESFYRKARVAQKLLMDGDEPAGGTWNFDHSNRQTWNGDPPVPERPSFEPDDVTREVIELVEKRYGHHFGSSSNFDLPVTHEDAERFATHFFRSILPNFGPYEDAMHFEEQNLFHSLCSAMINLGLLDPLDMCRRAEKEYRAGQVPIESAEAFVRQILGWREYVRHIYEEKYDHYQKANALDAHEPLPNWYWGERSELNCLDTTVAHLIESGHSHHITRLMVLSNLATLLGVDPHELNEWFWFGYIDAYEWVVTPNVVGMATWGDGGLITTKPYVSSGRYILKMGKTLCANCRYDPRKLLGEDACPFNSLYRDFLDRTRQQFEKLPRMLMILRQLERFDAGKRAAISRQASAFRERARATAYGSRQPTRDPN